MTLSNGSAPTRAHSNNSNDGAEILATGNQKTRKDRAADRRAPRRNGKPAAIPAPHNRLADLDEYPTPEAVPFSFRVMPLAAWVLASFPGCYDTRRPFVVQATDENEIHTWNQAEEWTGDFDTRLCEVPEGLTCIYFEFSKGNVADWYIGTPEGIEYLSDVMDAQDALEREVCRFLDGSDVKGGAA